MGKGREKNGKEKRERKKNSKWGVGGVRGWPDPEERCTRTPDSGSGHSPPKGKATGVGGLVSK